MKYLIIVAFIIAGIGCKNKRSYFEIKGKIVHAQGKKLFLKQLAIGNQNPILIDTALLAADGSFTMKCFMPFEQDIFVLSIDNGPDVYLVNDAPEIILQVDIDHYKAYTVEGSPASKQLHSFLDSYSINYKLLIEKINQYDSILQKTASDSVVLVYKQAKETALKTVNQGILTGVKESASPAFRSYLLAKSFATMDKETIAQLIGASKEQFKGYAPIEFLEKIIKQQLKETPIDYALLNKQAPSFTLPDTAGNMFYSDSLKGKYALIDFWASWCKPCRDENPNLLKVYKEFRNRNLTMVSVSLDSTRRNWKRAIEDDNLYWKQVSDLKEWKSPLAEKYKVTALPFNVLLDTTGKIIASNLKGRELTLKLNEVLPR